MLYASESRPIHCHLFFVSNGDLKKTKQKNNYIIHSLVSFSFKDVYLVLLSYCSVSIIIVMVNLERCNFSILRLRAGGSLSLVLESVPCVILVLGEVYLPYL